MMEQFDGLYLTKDAKRWQDTDWYSEITRRQRMAIASRAALRTISNYYGYQDVPIGDDLIQLFYLTLVAASQAIEGTEFTIYSRPAELELNPKMDWNKISDLTRRSAIEASFECIITSAETTGESQVGFEAAVVTGRKSVASAAYSQNSEQAATAGALDVRATRDGKNLCLLPLWHNVQISSEASKLNEVLSSDLDKVGHCDFWLRFYGGMWHGTFQEWALAKEVLDIPFDDWEKGYVHIGEVIAGIEARMQDVKTSESSNADLSMHRPNNVTLLFENAPQVRATFELSAATLNERFDLFYKMACPNDIIPLFEPLREMPATLARAADLLALGTRDKATEDALKDEVAKLRALLAIVEAELKAAKLDIEELKQKPWYKSAWVVAGGTGSVIGAVVGTAWMVSGDELGPQKRWDMLAEYWEFAFPREELKSEPLQCRFPETTDI